MRIDWVTWGVWGFGLVLLLYWCGETFREFKSLFRRRQNTRREPRN